MEDKILNELLERYRTGTATPEDKAFLESWYLKYNQSDPFIMTDEDRIKDVSQVYTLIRQNRISQNKINLWYYVAAAAVILITLSFGGYFLLGQKKIDKANTVAKNDISPGKNRATLILANGTKVTLSDAANGKLATEAGVSVKKTKNGELIYITDAVATNTARASSQFNTLQTARGEQYQVVLPDGTHIWLNAASSLKYPVAFADKERLVELTGEAYFEVAHNKTVPFRVKTQQQQVEVLGTHFNINAYDDEGATATTLIEGSVKVTLAANQKNIIIKPGQQSRVSNTDLSLQQVDTDDAIAWKNGYFQFNNESLESIMRKISRWYDVNVQYQDNALKDQIFGGTVSRYKKVSEVIKALEITNLVHFKIEGKKIIVLK